MRIIQPDTGLQRQIRSPFSEIGRLAVGFTDKTNPNRPFPRSTDYFVVRGEQADAFTERYGEKPQSLAVRFASDDPEFSCSERYELRNPSGKLVGFGNGQEFWFFDKVENNYSVYRNLTEKPNIMGDAVAQLTRGLDEKKAKNIGWKQVLYVRFLIPDFPMLGYWQFMTQGAKSSIPAIRDTFDNCLSTFGSVMQIPFSLQVKKVKSNNPGDAKQYSIVSLIPMISLDEGYKISVGRSPAAGRLGPATASDGPVVYELPEGTEEPTDEDEEQADYHTDAKDQPVLAQPAAVLPGNQTASASPTPAETLVVVAPGAKASPALTTPRRPGHAGFPADAGTAFNQQPGDYDKTAINGFAVTN